MTKTSTVAPTATTAAAGVDGQMIVIVNLTPHPIRVVDKNGNLLVEIPTSGKVARLKSSTVKICEINNIPITKTVYGEVENLPNPKDYVYYIVSQLIKNALPYRSDLLVPAEMLRDSSNNIIGCQSLGI